MPISAIEVQSILNALDTLREQNAQLRQQYGTIIGELKGINSRLDATNGRLNKHDDQLATGAKAFAEIRARCDQHEEDSESQRVPSDMLIEIKNRLDVDRAREAGREEIRKELRNRLWSLGGPLFEKFIVAIAGLSLLGVSTWIIHEVSKWGK